MNCKIIITVIIILNINNIYYRYGFSAAINSYTAFGFSCTGSEATLSACPELGAICRADDVNSAVAVECGGGTILQCNTVLLIMSVALVALIKGYVLCD